MVWVCRLERALEMLLESGSASEMVWEVAMETVTVTVTRSCMELGWVLLTMPIVPAAPLTMSVVAYQWVRASGTACQWERAKVCLSVVVTVCRWDRAMACP